MNKPLIIIASLMMVFFSNQAFADRDTIVSISVEGNRYVETAAIMAKIKSKSGAKLSRRQISEDVRRLFQTGLFSDVYTEGKRVRKGIKLIFVVAENPVIASVKIEGNDEIPDKKIKPFLNMKPGSVLSPRIERKDTYLIRKKYLKKGFYQCVINIQTIALKDGRVDIVIDIIEGDVTRAKEIRFLGNEHFTDEELLGTLASSPESLGSWFSGSDVFNEERFSADAQMLQAYYLDHGFLDAKIESTRLMLTPSMDGFYLALSIHEGQQFRVGGIEFQGDVVPSKEKLIEEVVLEKGDLYSVSKLRKSLEKVTEVVGGQGFAFATVTPLFHRNIESNTVVIVFDIEKGPEVYVERIGISGNTKTVDKSIRRELRQYEGERYDAKRIRRSKERLRRMSFIKNVSLSKQKVGDINHINLNLDIEEGKSGTFSAGVTYSQTNKVGFTGKVEEQNLLGLGYRANVSADVGGAANTYSLNLTDPYLIHEDVSGTFSIFRSQSDLQSFVNYDYDKKGGSVAVGMALSEYFRYSIGYNSATTTLALTQDPSTYSLSLREQVGTFTTGELTQSLSFDTRDRVVYPTEGGIQSISVGYAGLTGDHKFAEVNVSSKDYFPISETWTFRAVGKAGSIQDLGGVKVPIYRRYSIGGVGSLRGYDSFGVSLIDVPTGDILGADNKAMASLDFIFPLPYMEQAGFRGAFFIDAGTVWGTAGTVSEPFNLSKVRASYGFGIEWASPVGPLTMTWAKPINKQLLDTTRGFEFALGRGF